MTADRLELPVQVAAQAKADAIHAQMIATVPSYAQSVAVGQTTAWAKPYQDDISGKWCVNVKDRGRNSLSAPDKALLKPF